MTQSERDDMIDGMVAGLAARLEEQPNDPDCWVMLVRSHATLGNREKAEGAYARAVDVFSENPAVLANLRLQAGSLIGAQ